MDTTSDEENVSEFFPSGNEIQEILKTILLCSQNYFFFQSLQIN